MVQLTDCLMITFAILMGMSSEPSPNLGVHAPCMTALNASRSQVLGSHSLAAVTH